MAAGGARGGTGGTGGTGIRGATVVIDRATTTPAMMSRVIR